MRAVIPLLAALSAISAYNIAVFVPYMATSHVIFNVRIAETLAQAGHNVSLFVLAVYESNFQQIHAHKSVKYHFVNISTGADGDAMTHAHSQIVFESAPLWDERQRNLIAQMFGMVNACENLISNASFIEYVKEQKFDVAFAYMHSFCPMGLINVTGIPSWIWMNTGTLADFVADVSGVPLPSSYCTPTMMDAGDDLSFFQRVLSFIGWRLFKQIWPRVFANRETAMFRRHFGADFPHLTDLAKRTPLIMVNSHELYDYARPTLSKIVNIGGLGITKERTRPLEGLYANLTSSATDGIVVMTFGSVIPMFKMPQKWKDAFIYAFSQFPNVQFFLRYETDDLDGVLPSNVHISKWLPQKDLLQHPKARGLITHAGYNSFQDAVHSGVPMVTIPLVFDQPRNAHLAEKLGFGVHLRKGDIDRENVVRALRKMLTDSNMLSAARRIRAQLEKRPVSPETLLVKWTEMVAEFKTLDQLTPPSVHMNFIQLNSLDVVAFLLISVIISGYLGLKTLKWTRKRFFTSSDHPMKKKSD